MSKALVALVAVTVLAAAGCGAKSEGYSQARSLMGEMVKVVDEFKAAAAKATTGKEAAAAIDTFVGKFESVNARMNKVVEQYPKLEQAKLKADADRMAAALGKPPKIIMGLMTKFKGDPDVRKALVKFGKAAGM